MQNLFAIAAAFLLLPGMSGAQSTPVEGPRVVGFTSATPGAAAATLNRPNVAGDTWFEQFTAGLTAFGGNGEGTGMELGTLARMFKLTLSTTRTQVPAPTDIDPTRQAIVETKRYLYFAILNRASVNLDSLKALATDYVTSLQPSPITARLFVDFKITNREKVEFGTIYPDVRLLFQSDIRGVPFASPGGDIRVGITGHLFGTLKAEFQTDELNTGGQTVDEGTMYVEPSIYVAAASGDLAETLFRDGKKRALAGLDLRAGYRSNKEEIRDFGMLLQYTWQDLTGPTFRIGAQMTK